MRVALLAWGALSLHLLLSVGVSVAVLYAAPGYAPSPKEVILAINGNASAITKLSESLSQVTRRLDRAATPDKSK